MRYLCLILATALTACTGDTAPEMVPAEGPAVETGPSDDYLRLAARADTLMTQVDSIRVWSEENGYPGDTIVLDIGAAGYALLQELILKQGTLSAHNDVQLTQWDKEGNRHALVLIHKPDNGPHKNALPVQISVWVNGRHVSKDKKFFSYIILEDGRVMYSCYCGRQEFNEEPYVSQQASIRRMVETLLQ